MGSARRSVHSALVGLRSADPFRSASPVPASSPASTSSATTTRLTTRRRGRRLVLRLGLALGLDLADPGVLVQPAALPLAFLFVLLHRRHLRGGLDLADAALALIPAALRPAFPEGPVLRHLVRRDRRHSGAHRRHERGRRHCHRQLVEHWSSSLLILSTTPRRS